MRDLVLRKANIETVLRSSAQNGVAKTRKVDKTKTASKTRARPNAQKLRLIEDKRFKPLSSYPYLVPDLRFEDVPVLLAASRAGYHFIDTSLVVQMASWGKRKTQERLAYLVKHGYLERVYRPEFGRHDGLFRTIYKGCLVLRTLYDMPLTAFGSVYGRRLPRYDLVPHILDLGRLRVAVDKSAVQSGGCLVASLDDRGLQSYFTNNKTDLALLPDGYVKAKLSTGDTTHLFLEMDRGETYSSMRRKWVRRFHRYASFWFSGSFVRSFDLDHPNAEFRVVVATPNQVRTQYLMRLAQKEIPHYAHLFYFAHLPVVVTNNVFTSAIWLRGDGVENTTLYSFSHLL